VVTSSVAIAGVLLVFCYLIVPSVAAMLYADTIGKRLAVVCTFGLVLVLMALVRPLILRRAPA
jgi:zinc/manganese transport system permease protein